MYHINLCTICTKPVFLYPFDYPKSECLTKTIINILVNPVSNVRLRHCTPHIKNSLTNLLLTPLIQELILFVAEVYFLLYMIFVEKILVLRDPVLLLQYLQIVLLIPEDLHAILIGSRVVRFRPVLIVLLRESVHVGRFLVSVLNGAHLFWIVCLIVSVVGFPLQRVLLRFLVVFLVGLRYVVLCGFGEVFRHLVLLRLGVLRVGFVVGRFRFAIAVLLVVFLWVRLHYGVLFAGFLYGLDLVGRRAVLRGRGTVQRGRAVGRAAVRGVRLRGAVRSTVCTLGSDGACDRAQRVQTV